MCSEIADYEPSSPRKISLIAYTDDQFDPLRTIAETTLDIT